MKKRFRVLIGISLLAGLASSTIMHKKHSTKQADLIEFFLGSWKKNGAPTSEPAFLTIHETGLFTLNQRPLTGKIVQLNEQQLIFEDNYGYQLTLEKKGSHHLSLFDEAEDQEYSLERISNREA